MSKERYYYKKKYAGDYSAFGSAIVFTIVGILALVFNSMDIDFIGLRWWGYWLFIPAFFGYISAIGGVFNDQRMRRAVLGYIQSHPGGPDKIENISAQVGIKANDLLRILVDLRLKALIKYKYDAATGEVLIGETVQYEKSPEFVATPTKSQVATMAPPEQTYFCPYCGHKNPENSVFCINCGSKLQ